MSESFIEHWRQVAEFDYPALQAENERLTDLHRKAVAEAAILLEEKADRDEEIKRLREALYQIHTWLGMVLAGKSLDAVRGLIEDAYDEAGAAVTGPAEEIS